MYENMGNWGIFEGIFGEFLGKLGEFGIFGE
jgi:hypothetical protein